MRLSRRGLLAGLAAFAVAMPAAAKDAPLGKAFPYLEAYLRLPPGERDRFFLAYALRRDGQAAAGVRAWIVDGAARTPVPVGPHGMVERLPTLAQLQSQSARLQLDGPEDAKMGVTLIVEPNVRPATEMDAAALTASVTQAAAGARKAAGLLGFAVPKLTKVRMMGGSGGQAVFADGTTRPLPSDKGWTVFDPAALKGVVKIRFAVAPDLLTIA